MLAKLLLHLCIALLLYWIYTSQLVYNPTWWAGDKLAGTFLTLPSVRKTAVLKQNKCMKRGFYCGCRCTVCIELLIIKHFGCSHYLFIRVYMLCFQRDKSSWTLSIYVLSCYLHCFRNLDLLISAWYLYQSFWSWFVCCMWAFQCSLVTLTQSTLQHHQCLYRISQSVILQF